MPGAMSTAPGPIEYEGSSSATAFVAEMNGAVKARMSTRWSLQAVLGIMSPPLPVRGNVLVALYPVPLRSRADATIGLDEGNGYATGDRLVRHWFFSHLRKVV